MDEDDDRQHFSLKQLMWENTAEKMSKSKRKKLKRKKQKEGDTVQQADNFQVSYHAKTGTSGVQKYYIRS